jgi:hypothetical protein
VDRLDQPGGARVAAAVGVVRQPRDPGTFLAWVVADDGVVWQYDAAAAAWTPWGTTTTRHRNDHRATMPTNTASAH